MLPGGGRRAQRGMLSPAVGCPERRMASSAHLPRLPMAPPQSCTASGQWRQTKCVGHELLVPVLRLVILDPAWGSFLRAELRSLFAQTPKISQHMPVADESAGCTGFVNGLSGWHRPERNCPVPELRATSRGNRDEVHGNVPCKRFHLAGSRPTLGLRIRVTIRRGRIQNPRTLQLRISFQVPPFRWPSESLQFLNIDLTPPPNQV